MPREPKKQKQNLEVSSYTHEGDKRKNNPPVGLVSTATDKLNGKTRYQHDPHIDPSLSWAGKAEGLSFEVQNVSLHIHERIDPARIIKSFLKSKKTKDEEKMPLFASLFDEPENNPPLATAIDFYKHDQDWTNRLIAGDSLLVMNSLLVKEGMAGKVQMIYIDPPYGIKYNSNFQPFVNKRDVKDGNDDDLPAEPEMIQAFRDTWELGIHSYLTYLQDRLLLARKLLHESGSLFIQISDENVHHVREICDGIFGSSNFIATIAFKKKKMPLGETFIFTMCDYILWYGMDYKKTKYNRLFTEREYGINSDFNYIELKNGEVISLKELRKKGKEIPKDARYLQLMDMRSTGRTESCVFEYEYHGNKYYPAGGKSWKTNIEGMRILEKSNRLIAPGDSLRYKLYWDDYPVMELSHMWMDTQGATGVVYVVQTSEKPISRCILMTSDPGDLIIDITCGSGTTAFIAEQYGRRWITCDTSRVAITLAKQRLMTAKYDYYTLSNIEYGIKGNFRYKEVPHVTLGSISNNEPSKTETLFDHPFIDKTKIRVTGPFTVEAVPSLRVKPFDGQVPVVETTGAENARVGETNRQAEWREELKATGIRAVGGKHITFSRIEPTAATRYLHARGELLEKDGSFSLAFISFGPDYGPLEQRQVEAAVAETRGLKEKPSFLIFAAFHFDPEASKDINEIKWPGVKVLQVQMSVDLLTSDLRKKRSSNQSYWLIGQPDVTVKKLKDGNYAVKLNGFDYYNPITGEIESKSAQHIAMWFLDTDYDDRSMMPDQVFFPKSDDKRGWARLAKALKSEVDKEALEAFTGVESRPFGAGENNKVAVKIIDNRGIESFVIKELG